MSDPCFLLTTMIAGVTMANQALKQRVNPDCEPASDVELAAEHGADLDEARLFRDWVLGGIGELSFRCTSMVAGVTMACRILQLASDPDADPESYPLSDAEVLDILGADSDESHQFRDWVLERILAVHEAAVDRAKSDVVEACLEYIFRHPYSVDGRGGRFTCSDGFRRFILELVGPGGPGEGMPADMLASVTRVPLATLEEWLASRAFSAA